ncbi:recombinase RecT [Streptococcus gallolyticus]|nr:recombinase RecT [Streptococcus gallolyticus]MBY5040429.1 recombinase RecT [Streptococcus gallolyticus]
MTNQVAAYTHKQYFNAPNIQKTFNNVWKGAGAQFATSILSVIQGSNALKSASNESIMTAAMKAAVLNLPIEPSLGRAYLVPYKGQAQFQLGYKGLIELAQRSGQYRSINAGVVYKAQFKSYDPFFETLEVDFSQPQDEVVGYFASFELLNGFRKIAYWTKTEVYNHGKKFSKTFNNGPWETDFDAMARKTVLKNILSTYGPLSVEMQKAIQDDNEDVDLERQIKEAEPIENTETLSDLLNVSETPVESENVSSGQITETSKTEGETGEKTANKSKSTSTEYPAEEIPDFDAETGEILEGSGNLFDNLEDLMP